MRGFQLFFTVFGFCLLADPFQPALAQPTNAGATAPVPAIKIIHTPHFRLPIDCTIGTDCWVLNYPDIGPDKDGVAIDPACNARTYDGHKGTDIMIPDTAAMARGVDVLAAADGKVLRARDGEKDHFPLSKETLEDIKAARKECGNAVLIDHGDGWQTMYCHMKQNSLVVKSGDVVKAGDKIGQVGASGMTQFPHIHIGITHKGATLDPFTGHDITDACGTSSAPLWSKAANISYQPLTIYAKAFVTKPPTMESIEAQSGNKEDISTTSPALLFYAVTLGVKKDDVIKLEIIGPDDKIFARNQVKMEKDRARQMLFVGRAIKKSAPIEPGIYNGKITIVRTNDKGEPEQFGDTLAQQVQ